MAQAPNTMLRSRKTGRFGAGAPRGRSLGLSGHDVADMVRQVEKGFPYAALVRFHKESGLGIGTIAAMVRLPQRTLMRRKAKGRLEPGESDRLLRVSGIFERAVDLFEGDAEAARRWLTTPSKELGDASPLDFARTELGAREVEDLMARLEHGVFT